MFVRRAVVTAIAALVLGAAPGLAQPYPSRPIKLILPFTAGSPNDVTARLLAQHLAPRLGQPIIIDNKPGGGTSIGTKLAASAEPDGYTLLFISSALVIDPAMKGVDYDPLKDFAPVASVVTTYLMLTATPSLPVTTLAELIAYTKANPGTVNLAATQGSVAMLVAGKFKQASGADIQIIPYKGGAAALPDFLAGRVQMMVPTPATSIALIRAGKMRGLAISSATRIRELPDVPTMREVGLPDLTLEFWAGILAPAGTPPAIVGRLNEAINETLQSAEMKESMGKLSLDAKIGSPQEFATFIKEEIPRWNAIAKSSGVKIE
jgi:tripartite-type tricarboxylate transporter receptor subunit TctC